MYEAAFSFSANETALRRFSLFRFYWLRPLGIVLRGRFLFVTTSEKKNGFLLIETFRKTKLRPPGFDPWWSFTLLCSSMTKMGVIYRLSTDYITIYYEDFWVFAVFRSLNLVGLSLAIIYKYK
jgi:hypothetical protein